MERMTRGEAIFRDTAGHSSDALHCGDSVNFGRPLPALLYHAMLLLNLTILLSLLRTSWSRPNRKHNSRDLRPLRRSYHGFSDLLSAEEEQISRGYSVPKIEEMCPGCSQDPNLYLRKLKHHKYRDAVCNDGTHAGYYIRKVHDPKTWVIYLQGGFYCNDEKTCTERFRNDRDLMGSGHWPLHKRGQGILDSTDMLMNPLAWGSNLVYIPYCTSDLWLGDSLNDENEVWRFRGARVIKRVIESLIEDGMREATRVLVTGTSAGGVGVMFHIDNIANQLRKVNSTAEVRGIADSGWFIETGNVPAEQGNFRNWQVNKTVGNKCLELNKGNQWKCLYGSNIYPKIKAPIMIVQFYYDPIQIQMHGYEINDIFFSNWYGEMSNNQVLRKIIEQVKSSLRDLDTVFGVSCFGHGILSNTKLFSEVKVRGVTLLKAIECWYMGVCPKRNMDICEDNALCNESCMRRDLFWMMSILQPQQDRSWAWRRQPVTYASKYYTTPNFRGHPDYQYYTVDVPNT